MKQVDFPRTTRWLLPLAGLAAGALAARLAWRRLLTRALPPRNGRISADGLHQPVEVIRDRWGVPHIYAADAHDLFFAQGYVHAQDRLFQMDTHRRVGSGRISEIVGASGVASDRFARFLGWTRAAEAQVAGADAEVRDTMAAYAAGVNAYIVQGRLPLEFTLLAYRPEPWALQDTAAWGTVLAWGLSVNWETELLRLMLLETLGPEKTADLTPAYADSYDTVLPASVGHRLSTALLEAYHEAMDNLPLGAVPAGRGVGSNNWVVSGANTVSGRPILANDPHLPPTFPALWYENHLSGGGYNVTGFTMPGVPGVIIGHNEHVAWGVTNAFPDVQDVYVERFDPADPTRYEVDDTWHTAELCTETIRIRGRKPLVETVRYTRHGPVFSDLLPDEARDLALRWSLHEPSNHLRTILDTNRATDWDTFRDGLRHWSFASQNVVYADTAGNVGYVMPGRVPRRRKGNGLVPVPGWRSDYEWDGWIPFAELPARFNPPEGLIATANNRVHGADYPHLLSSEWLPGYRVRRILHLLRENVPLTLADNGRIHTDTFSLPAQRFLPHALSAVAAAASRDTDLGAALHRLRAWEGDMRADEVAPTLFFGWLTHFTHAVFRQAVGPALAGRLLGKQDDVGFPLHPFYEMAGELVLMWLDDGPPAWVGEIRPLLLPALEQTLVVLRGRFGADPQQWRWGRLHVVDLHNPLADVPLLGRVWKPIRLATGGDGYTVNQGDVHPHFPPDPVHVIASCRLIIDVGAWDNSLAVLPGGQSAQPASAHYQDGIAAWRDGRYHPLLFSRERIVAAAEGTVWLAPP